MDFAVRKIALAIEEIRHDGGPSLALPRLKGAVAAIVRNPFAGRHEPVLEPHMDALKPLGLECSTRLLAALGGEEARIEAYGKGALVGGAGEVEHGALWHAPGGYAMRERLGKALAIVPSTAKLGAIGASIDIPIHHRNAAYVRSHFDTMTVTVADSPRADEIMFVLVMATGARPHARVGGLAQDAISKWDGQR